MQKLLLKISFNCNVFQMNPLAVGSRWNDRHAGKRENVVLSYANKQMATRSQLINQPKPKPKLEHNPTNFTKHSMVRPLSLIAQVRGFQPSIRLLQFEHTTIIDFRNQSFLAVRPITNADSFTDLLGTQREVWDDRNVFIFNGVCLYAVWFTISDVVLVFQW